MDVAEHLAGEPARGMLPDLLEQGVAKIVGEDPGEAGGRVSGDQAGHHSERDGRARHAVDDRLVGEGHGEHDGLAGEHEQDGGDDPRLELGLALRPQHRQEAQQGLNPAVRLVLLMPPRPPSSPR